MQGLVFEQPYLDRILNGWVFCDRRMFSTSKRGRIALVDSTDGKVKGFADLHNVVPITYRDYLDQHNGHTPNADPWASHRTYYELRFRDVEKLRNPISIPPLDIDAVWIDVPGYVLASMKQRSILEF